MQMFVDASNQPVGFVGTGFHSFYPALLLL
jgi:hypothetical protein